MINIDDTISKIPAPQVFFENREMLKHNQSTGYRRAIAWGSSVAAVVIIGLHITGIMDSNKPKEIVQVASFESKAAAPHSEVERVQRKEISEDHAAILPVKSTTTTLAQQKINAEPTAANTPQNQRLVKLKVGAKASTLHYAEKESPQVDMTIPTVEAPKRNSRFKVDVIEMFKSNNTNNIGSRFEDFKEESRIFFEMTIRNSILTASND